MRGENFDGNDAVEASVVGAVDLAHASGAERGLNFVRAEFCAGGQRHGVRAIIAWRSREFRVFAGGVFGCFRVKVKNPTLSRRTREGWGTRV